jgi:hypothetical protein
MVFFQLHAWTPAIRARLMVGILDCLPFSDCKAYLPWSGRFGGSPFRLSRDPSGSNTLWVPRTIASDVQAVSIWVLCLGLCCSIENELTILRIVVFVTNPFSIGVSRPSLRGPNLD